MRILDLVEVTVKYMLGLREITGGKKEDKLRISGSTLTDLLKELTKLYGNRIRYALFDRELTHISPSIIIMINGREARHLKDLETNLVDGDEIVIVPPAGGG